MRAFRPGDVLAAVLLLLIGVVFGTLGTAAHQATLVLLGAELPVGLVIALAAVAALLIGLRGYYGSRLPAMVVALGIVAAVGVLALPGPGDSALMPANAAGTIWAIAPTLLAAVVLAWPRLPPKTAQADE